MQAVSALSVLQCSCCCPGLRPLTTHLPSLLQTLHCFTASALFYCIFLRGFLYVMLVFSGLPPPSSSFQLVVKNKPGLFAACSACSDCFVSSPSWFPVQTVELRCFTSFLLSGNEYHCDLRPGARSPRRLLSSCRLTDRRRAAQTVYELTGLLPVTGTPRLDDSLYRHDGADATRLCPFIFTC